MENIQLVISNEVHEIELKECEGQRVITFKDVDTLHRRPSGTSRRTFKSQKKHMIADEDYFVRNTSEALSQYRIKAPNGIVLLTESGYLLLVKTFTDDLAWKVQRQLIRAYFKTKPVAVEVVQIPQIPTSYEDIMIFALQSQKEMKNEMAQLKLVVDNEIHLNDHQLAEVQEAVKARVGYLQKQGYEKHFQSIYSALKTFFTVPKYDKIKRGDFDKAIDFINGWFPKKDESGNGGA